MALAALGYGHYGTESRQIRRERYQAIAAIGTLKADQVQLWRQACLDHAAALSCAPSVSRQLADLAINPKAGLSAAQTVIETGIRSYGYAGTFVLTSAGAGLLAAGPRAHAALPRNSPVVAAALAGTTAVMGDFFRSDDGVVYLDVAAAVRVRGGVVGVLGCEHTGRWRRWTHDEQTFAVALVNLVGMLLVGAEGHPRLEPKR